MPPASCAGRRPRVGAEPEISGEHVLMGASVKHSRLWDRKSEAAAARSRGVQDVESDRWSDLLRRGRFCLLRRRDTTYTAARGVLLRARPWGFRMSELSTKIDDRSAHVCVVGLGYVGLPLAVAFAEAGFRITGLDVTRGRVDELNAGRSYIPDISSESVAAQTSAGRLRATVDADVLADADTVHICVPTPLGKTKDPDVSYVVAVADEVGRRMHPGLLTVLESTTYPGTTEEIMLPRLAAEGGEVGVDFHLAFSPERIDPGNETYTLKNTPKIIGAMTPACANIAKRLYGTIIDEVYPVSSPRAAELVKLLENDVQSRQHRFGQRDGDDV